VENFNKPLTLSIVIPVYNEERYIKKCLDSIEKQKIMPKEVIIVDNNCTDKTINIASKYKFVRIVQEKKQGKAFARNKGFNSAKTDVIGRIDADSVLVPTWTQTIIEKFQDENIAAITGPGYTLAFPKVFGHQLFSSYYSGLWSRIYLIGATGIMRLQALWGANMAIRLSAWKIVVKQVCIDDKKVHEDQDLAIVLASNGLASIYSDKLRIFMNGESFFVWPKYSEYIARSFGTYGYRIKLGDLSKNNLIRKPLYFFPLSLLIITIPTTFFTIGSFLTYYMTRALGKLSKDS
jgi:glycosyltransferase involved in cell wall biosynthesis